jgi:hypothetical protein
MLVRELLTDACYESINDENFQPALPPGRLNQALRKLNPLLDELRDYIPYAFEYRYTDVNDLTNTQFVMVNSVGYVIDTVVLPVKLVGLTQWREDAVVENLTGIPQIAFFDESTQSIRVYPAPSNQNYTIGS